MSADNYYRIFRFRESFYPVMGFMSDEAPLVLSARHVEHGGFPNLSAAMLWVQEQQTEYGYEIDGSALEPHEPTEQQLLTKIRAIRRLHRPEEFGDCVEDGDPYPCKTVRILDLAP